MRSARRHLATIAAAATLLSLAPAAQGYYFFVRYFSRTAPWNAVVERFDLNALQNKTVPYLIAEGGPAAMSAGDNFPGLVSQIRLAAKVWNDVETSDLRLAFGGFFTPGMQHSSPAIEVVFDEVPPGLLAYGGPTAHADPAEGMNGTFVPVQRSTLVLPRNLDRASWSEGLFLTIVHELGHCLGLQHTLTSSVMSTSITRATTKARPLAADDIAGVSLLYPARGPAWNWGTLAGRVLYAGGGNNAANLASVVAISQDGNVVSALTQPDGSYRIEGVPPGSYSVYAHPLPPAVSGETFPANVTPPRDSDTRFIAATQAFETQFYPGTRDPVAAAVLAVAPGSVLESINFTVTRRNAPAVFGVQTYSFPGQVAVKPAYLAIEGLRSFIVAAGYGLTDRAAVGVMGGAATIPSGGVKPYPQDTRYLQMDFQFNITSSEGTRHLTFAADNDLYVLPSAFRLTKRPPPTVTNASPTLDGSGNRIVVISGANLNASTRILFDGVPALIRTVDETNSTITVTPPPAATGERAAVVAFNADGQSSLFVQASPVTYEYENSDTGNLVVSPAVLQAGTETVVEITAVNGGFSPSFTSVAFGSSGVVTRRVFVTAPNRLLATVMVSPGAAIGTATVTVMNGLRISSLPGGIQVIPANPRVSWFRGPAADADSGRTAVPPGGVGTVRLAGLLADAPASSLRLTIGDAAAAIVSSSGGMLMFRVPAALPAGPAVMRLVSGTDTALPSVLAVDLPPPTITGVTISGARVDTATRPARPEELVQLSVANLAEPGTEVSPAAVTVKVGELLHRALQVNVTNGSHQVLFVLDKFVATGVQPLSVQVDGRLGAVTQLPIRGN